MSTTDPTGSADRTLRDLLRTDGRLSFERASQVLADVAEALAPMHAAGQAHGAVTPQSVRLADGRATLGPPVADTVATGLLPPAYLAPERIAGEPASPRGDVYTLGLLGWEMLTGTTPWADASPTEVLINQQEQDLPRLTTVRPGVPRPLLLAIEGALHKSPGDRWATAGEMLATLGATPAARPTERPAIALGPITAHREPVVPVRPVSSRPRKRSRGKVMAGIALALAVLIAGGAALASMQGREKQRVTQPWLDSLTTSTSAGVVITDDTLSSAARLRAQQQARRDSIAAYGSPTPYPSPTYTPPPASDPAPTPYPATTPTPLDPQEVEREDAAARAELARRRAEDSARAAATPPAPVADTPATPPALPTLPAPTAPVAPRDSARPAAPSSTPSPAPAPAPADSARRTAPPPKPDTTPRPDTSRTIR